MVSRYPHVSTHRAGGKASESTVRKSGLKFGDEINSIGWEILIERVQRRLVLMRGASHIGPQQRIAKGDAAQPNIIINKAQLNHPSFKTRS